MRRALIGLTVLSHRPSMPSFGKSWLLGLSILMSHGTSLAADAPQCAYTPEYLTSKLGIPFKAGVPENGIIGKGCRYESKKGEIKLWVDAGPNPAPSAEAWRKMAFPPGTIWKTVPNDPDRAMHDFSPNGLYPSLFYERKGWIAHLTMTGTKTDKASVDAWNAKLVKLQRQP